MSPIHDRCPDCDERPTCCCQFDVGPTRADIAKAKKIIGAAAFFIAVGVVAAITLGAL